MRPVTDQSSLRIHAFKNCWVRKIIIGGLGTESRKFQANFHMFTFHSPNSLALDLMMEVSCLSLNTIKQSIYTANYEFDKHYKNITIQIYWKQITTKKWKFSDKKFWYFFFSA